MGATKLGLALLTLVAQTGAQEVGLAGPVGAGRSIQFHRAYDKGLMTHSGGVSDWNNVYAGGDPGCCEMCRKEFEKGGRNPSVWGGQTCTTMDGITSTISTPALAMPGQATPKSWPKSLSPMTVLSSDTAIATQHLGTQHLGM